MFNRKHDDEVKRMEEVAAVVKSRLLLAVILGALTVATTGLNASFTYYSKELPATIRSLNGSVTALNRTILDIDRRVSRLEEEERWRNRNAQRN